MKRYETPFGVFYEEDPIEVILSHTNVIGLFGGYFNEENDEYIRVNEPIRAIINGYDYSGTGYKINYTILPFSLFSYTDDLNVSINSIIKINRVNRKVYELFIKPHYNNFRNDIIELDNLVDMFSKDNMDIVKYQRMVKDKG